VVSYEHLPRFTDRSSQFRQDAAGRWHPVSSKSGAGDGAVSKEKARAYQEDLLAYARTDEARGLFRARLSQWQELRGMLNTGDGAALESKLKQLLTDSPNDPYTEALVRDLIEASQRTLLSEKSPLLTPGSVGLSEIATASGSTSNKNLLIKKYPEWAKILENPETGIASLVAKNEWGTLGAITDVIVDPEFNKLLCTQLGKIPPTAESRAFIQMLIEKGDQSTLRDLAEHTFRQPHTAEMKDLLRLVIEKGDQDTLQYLAVHTLQ